MTIYDNTQPVDLNKWPSKQNKTNYILLNALDILLMPMI